MIGKLYCKQKIISFDTTVISKFKMELLLNRKRKSIDNFVWSCFIDKFNDYKKQFLKLSVSCKEKFIIDKFVEYENKTNELRGFFDNFTEEDLCR